MPINALDDAFARESSALALPGGTSLVEAGEAVTALYRLTAGRLAEVEPLAAGGDRLLAVHRPGALIGGAQILGDGRHRTRITALRDSELEAIPVERAEALLREDPHLLSAVARATLARMRPAESAERRNSAVIGLASVGEGVRMREMAERLAVAMRALGAEVAVLGSEADDSDPAYLHALEVEHDFVLMAAERSESDFAAYCGRQIDRLVLVARADSDLPAEPVRIAGAAIRQHRLADIVLIQPSGARRPHRSDAWLDAEPVSRLFHVREGVAEDMARLARIYTGNSVGLALSGGGARAYAHVGAIRALRELGVPIDFIAGTSMGAVIGAGLAMGWDRGEMDRRIREAFVRSSPLSDVAFPILAMTGGRTVEERLEIHFGEAQIADLWRPFLCVSSDLTSGGMHIHRRGLLRAALRASLSLPGVLPPVIEDDHVLVDGALARNLPADLVCEQHEGVTVAVNAAASGQGLTPDDLEIRPRGLYWVTSGAWRKGPPIVAVLIRSATMPSAAGAASAARDERILDIVPDVRGVGLQDWKAYDEAVEAGYRAAMAMAERLSALKR